MKKKSIKKRISKEKKASSFSGVAGKVLRAERKKYRTPDGKKLSAAKMAVLLGYSTSVIHKMERGTLEVTLERFCAFLTQLGKTPMQIGMLVTKVMDLMKQALEETTLPLPTLPTDEVCEKSVDAVVNELNKSMGITCVVESVDGKQHGIQLVRDNDLVAAGEFNLESRCWSITVQK